ncbi:multidrug effflux MFS transporter [Nocardioides sp. LHG3406-4]|uniref:multidrug effflux MFS transporter n=1 Tax=Nocardioides sp. LHG3406-4 TaxID=2804575 RepID=UPI003CF2FBCD
MPSQPVVSFAGRSRMSPKTAMLVVPLLLAGLSMLGPFSIDTPFPAFKRMGADLDVSTDQMQLVVSAYLLSFGLMSPFHGPLSDAIGRRPVILGGCAVFAVASIGCAFSTSLPMLLTFRVLQGLSAGGGVIVSRTVIRDVFDGPQAQRLMSRVMMIFGAAPAIAPIVGGFLLQAGPWPVIFWFLAVVGLLLVALVAVFLPETHPKERRTPLAVGSLLASLGEVSRDLRFHRVAWAAALSFAGQFIYIGSAPIFVVDLLGKGELDFWVFFLPMISGVMLGAWVSGRAAGRVSGRRLVTWSLLFASGAALLNVGLALLPTAAELPYAVVGPGLIAVGTAAAYPTLQLVLLDMFPRSRGASVSMFTFFALLLNGITAAVVTPWVTHSVLTLALGSTVLVLGGMLCWVWHLRTGPRPVPAKAPEPIKPTESL